jgi:hypothetical protein
MLYPIELLRHKSTTRNAVRWTACMLTGMPAFVMSSVGLFKCRQAPSDRAGFVCRANCITAKCYQCKLQCEHLDTPS